MSIATAADTVPSSTAFAPRAGAPFAIHEENPLLIGAELKAFMAESGHATFFDVFDRGYDAAVHAGASCWVGRDSRGMIVVSITRFIHTFRYRDHVIRAGVLGDLMAAPSHRTFFPALALVKRLLADTRAARDIDMLYGDPNESAAAIMKAAKLQHIDALDRMVIPVADSRWLANLAFRSYSTLMQWRLERPAHAADRLLTLADLPLFAEPLGRADRMLPLHRGTILRRRLRAFPGPTDRLVELRVGRDTTPWNALALLRGPCERRIVHLVGLQRMPGVELPRIVSALIPVVRSMGGNRLQIDPLRGSHLREECRTAGFVSREDGGPLYAQAFTNAGREALADAASWELTSADLER